MISEKAESILSFWFGEHVDYSDADLVMDRVKNMWFDGGEEVDNEIRDRFGAELEVVAPDSLEPLSGLREKLAAVILLDQFSRNIFRDSARAFAQDHLARGLVKELISGGKDAELEPIERLFVYLPLEHSENMDDQKQSVEKYEQLHRDVDQGLKKVYENFLDYAVKHRDVIERFGRFPHRNEALQLTSTADELEYLKDPAF